VGLDAFVSQGPGRLESLGREAHLDDHVVGPGDVRFGFPHHALGVGGQDLSAHGAIHDGADLLDNLGEVTAFLGHQRRVGGHSSQNAPRVDGPDLIHVGGVQKEFHVCAPPSAPLRAATRPSWGCKTGSGSRPAPAAFPGSTPRPRGGRAKGAAPSPCRSATPTERGGWPWLRRCPSARGGWPRTAFPGPGSSPGSSGPAPPPPSKTATGAAP